MATGARDANYYTGKDAYSSPGAVEIQTGFGQFRYSPMGVTDNQPYPPLAEADILDGNISGGEQPAPDYDRHII